MDPYIGEIRAFAFEWFGTSKWVPCDGQELLISEYRALYDVIRTTYGGNGTTTFKVPDLRGLVPMMAGAGAGLTPRNLGEQGGSETVTLTTEQLPAHIHDLVASTTPGNTAKPAPTVALARTQGATPYEPVSDNPPLMPMHASAIGLTGDGQPHTNVMPYLVFRFFIATDQSLADTEDAGASET